MAPIRKRPAEDRKLASPGGGLQQDFPHPLLKLAEVQAPICSNRKHSFVSTRFVPAVVTSRRDKKGRLESIWELRKSRGRCKAEQGQGAREK